jgi:hypothetical protein
LDVDRFDGLARILATTGTRRGLLLLASALPLVGGLLTQLTEGAAGPGGSGNGAIVGGGGGRRRKNRHNPGQNNDNRDDNRNDDRDDNRKKRNRCKPEPKARTCARKCGKVRNNCGTRVNCGSCLVFATSTLQNGNLGGLNGADAICQARARAGGLPGTYRAWLSDNTGSPSTRFRRSGQGYRLPDQAEIATAWTDLTDGTLNRAINVTELGGTVSADPAPAARAWSNTAVAGTVRTDVPNDDLACVNWTYNGGGEPRPGVFGGTGTTTATDAKWTAEGSSPCGVPRRRYCFQQP